MKAASAHQGRNSSDRQEVDLWMLRDNLKATYEERIQRHQDTLDCVEALKQVRSINCAKSLEARDKNGIIFPLSAK